MDQVPSNTDAVRPAVPLHRYIPGGPWETVPHQMLSPAPDGSVAYYVDSLADGRPEDMNERPLLFEDDLARALCRHLVSKTVQARREIVDGPYIQVLEDDGSIPPGWVMLRAIVWVDEFDQVVPVDTESADATEIDVTLEPVHKVSIELVHDSQVRAVCSCGRYRSKATVPYAAAKLGRAHSKWAVQKWRDTI